MMPLFYSAAARPADEASRQRAVDDLRLGAAADPALDDIVRRAGALAGTPMAAISIIDGDRQRLPAEIGLGVRETSRAVAFCAHTILDPDRPLCVEDARSDFRFSGNPLVLSGPNVRFYAGVPLVDADGHALGALCVLDDQCRAAPSPDVIDALRALARQAVAAMADGGRPPSEDIPERPQPSSG